jgi:hypothetical protein
VVQYSGGNNQRLVVLGTVPTPKALAWLDSLKNQVDSAGLSAFVAARNGAGLLAASLTPIARTAILIPDSVVVMLSRTRDSRVVVVAPTAPDSLMAMWLDTADQLPDVSAVTALVTAGQAAGLRAIWGALGEHQFSVAWSELPLRATSEPDGSGIRMVITDPGTNGEVGHTMDGLSFRAAWVDSLRAAETPARLAAILAKERPRGLLTLTRDLVLGNRRVHATAYINRP